MSNNYNISKILSRNDTGENDTHQAGILIPKNPPEILTFFPKLDNLEKNPRITMSFVDTSDRKWEFNYIYYNNKFFEGTRNEYRLTGMTEYIRTYNLKSGDKIILRKTDEHTYFIDCVKNDTFVNKGATGNKVLSLSNKWKVIHI